MSKVKSVLLLIRLFKLSEEGEGRESRPSPQDLTVIEPSRVVVIP
jgi:hypothetical protein